MYSHYNFVGAMNPYANIAGSAGRYACASIFHYASERAYRALVGFSG